jgi:hypothetical protein
MVRFLSIGTMQTPIPEQSFAGDQPRKVEPSSAMAERVTASLYP